MIIFVIIGIIVAIVGIVLIILINQYNRFQWVNTLVNKGESHIRTSLSEKHDILIRYIEQLKENKIEISDVDYSKFKLLNLKQPINKLSIKIDEENKFIDKIMDNNEKLLKNKTIININKDLKEANININGGKKYYNDNLVLYNHLCNAFPSNIIAKIKKYNEKEFLNDEIKEDLKILDEENDDE